LYTCFLVSAVISLYVSTPSILLLSLMVVIHVDFRFVSDVYYLRSLTSIVHVLIFSRCGESLYTGNLFLGGRDLIYQDPHRGSAWRLRLYRRLHVFTLVRQLL
jgi:hypothetical protein